MAGKLEQVVPFGRSLDEYRKMFDLAQNDVSKRIVGVGDGSASLNAEMSQLSGIHDKMFDLALCSYFFFLYSDQFDEEFHAKALVELVRVAKEVRIFPLLTLKGIRSKYVEPLMLDLQEQGCDAEIQEVQYELQRGGNEMLVIKES